MKEATPIEREQIQNRVARIQDIKGEPTTAEESLAHMKSFRKKGYQKSLK